MADSFFSKIIAKRIAHCGVRRASGTLSPTYQRNGNTEIVKITKVQWRAIVLS
jgi:hypothetical protein